MSHLHRRRHRNQRRHHGGGRELAAPHQIVNRRQIEPHVKDNEALIAWLTKDGTEEWLTTYLAEKLVRTRDVKEALELQGEYMRNQISALQTQAKEFATLSESIKADLNKTEAKA